jgi:hypothetical protein
MMFIVTHLNFLHIPRSLGMVLSELLGNKIEIRNVIKNQDDVKCPNKYFQYFAQNYFCVSYYFKIAMPWHVFHLPLPRGSMALVGIGLQYEVPRSHSDTPRSVRLPERAIGLSQSPLTDKTQYSQKTDT